LAEDPKIGLEPDDLGPKPEITNNTHSDDSTNGWIITCVNIFVLVLVMEKLLLKFYLYCIYQNDYNKRKIK